MGKRSRRILTALGVLIVLLGVVYAVLMIRATVKLRRAYAALEADGRPMQTAEIMPAKVPDAENAAILYQSAILMLKGQPDGDKSLFEHLTGRSTVERRKAEAEWLGSDVITRALSLVEQGTHRPACQLEHDNGNVLDVMNAPPVDDLRKLGIIMRAKADYELRAGNPAAAWDVVLTQLRFADSLRSDLSTQGQFARVSVAAWACGVVRRLCETAPPEPQRWQTTEDLLERQDDIGPFLRAIDGERLLIGEWFFSLPRRELDKILWKEDGQDGVIPPGVLKAMHRISFIATAFRPRLIADHAAYLQVMRKRVQLLQGPYRTREEIDKFIKWSRWDYLTARLTWSAWGERWFYAFSLTSVQVTRAGLALLQYKQEHGAFPETLDALGIEGLTDPYTDKPLHYRAQGDGFVVYSVGEDLKDNGGTPRQRQTDSNPRHKPVEYDEVWQFPNPENQPAEEAEQPQQSEEAEQG